MSQIQSIRVEDELSPNFINQPGWSMNIGVSGSGLGEGLCFSFYDEYENDIDSIFIQDRQTVEKIRDVLNQVLATDHILKEES